MKIATLALTGGMIGALLAGKTLAQDPGTPNLYQPASVQQAAVDSDNLISYAAPKPQSDASQSPSDRPAPQPQPDENMQQPPAPAPDNGGADNGGGDKGDADDGDKPWHLPQPCILQRLGITLGGWTETGFAINNHDPVPDYNGVVAFPDKGGQFLLDQQWFFLDKPIKNDGCGFAWGGHVDFMLGSDAIFTQSFGLETSWKQEDFYQVALPQFYLDIAYNDLTVRMGHFYTILGYEVVQAPQNFFYTHSYCFMYGEPFMYTGMLFTYKMNEQLSVSAGFTRGDDQFEARPGADHMGFVGGLKWTSASKKLELALSLDTSEMIVPENHQEIMSFVATYHVSKKFKYVFQNDYGQNANGYVVGGPKAVWYGFNNYFLYDFNKCWSAGLRAEYFRDDSGVRVTGVRDTNPEFGHYFPGSFSEISLGLNWKPHANFTARPELRWDWYDAAGNVNYLPFDNGARASQFLAACDFILTY